MNTKNSINWPYDQDDPFFERIIKLKEKMSILIYCVFHQNFCTSLVRESPRGKALYTKSFIMDDASNFLPLYLRFTREIIDTKICINISRGY